MTSKVIKWQEKKNLSGHAKFKQQCLEITPYIVCVYITLHFPKNKIQTWLSEHKYSVFVLCFVDNRERLQNVERSSPSEISGLLLQTRNIQFVKDETFCLGITLVEVCWNMINGRKSVGNFPYVVFRLYIGPIPTRDWIRRKQFEPLL